jgi:hypothetical protein
LHTWSLAVEEQFYILFPIFLVIVRRFFPKHLRISVIGIFLVSLIASALIVPYSSVTAFYMPYTRAWELLLGTMLSLGMFPRLRSRLTRNIATLTGIGMIAFCIDRFNLWTPFPGLTALVPCIGSALIIGTGESGSSLVGAVLSWPPVVFIGLISYSLYLWHWPVIVLRDMGVFNINEMLPDRLAKLISASTYAQVLELSVSLLLGVFSWRFVERPFRSGPLRLGGLRLFALAGSVMLIFISYSTFVVLSSGLPSRFSPLAVQLASHVETGNEDKLNRVGTCFLTLEQPFSDYKQDVCLHRDEGKKSYLLLGDSHSAVLWRPLSTLLPDVNIMQASCGGFRPFVHIKADRQCTEMFDYIFQSYLPAHPVQELLLEGEWRPGDVGALAETLDWARQHQVPVILLGPVPEYDAPLPRLLAYSVTWKKPDLASQHLLPNIAALDAQLQNLAATTWHVHYISLYQAICNREGCTEYADKARTVPLMVDSHHLSSAGSSLIVRRLIAQGDLNEAYGEDGGLKRPPAESR